MARRANRDRKTCAAALKNKRCKVGAMAGKRIPDHLQKWIDARKRHRLSHAHIQMARELGMKPKSLGKLDNHKQDRWKLPLPQFLEELYFKCFHKERPDNIASIEERALIIRRKKEARTKARQEQRAAQAENQTSPPPADIGKLDNGSEGI